ncbi:hypothetical protein GZL_00154 [Streptomyces sp. 769]|nr:hypothetical protein GZL_00154 [Streptomyces sp. 769]
MTISPIHDVASLLTEYTAGTWASTADERVLDSHEILRFIPEGLQVRLGTARMTVAHLPERSVSERSCKSVI